MRTHSATRNQYMKVGAMRLLASFAAVLLLVGTAAAGPPAAGTYLSTDMGGSVLTGYFSESWVAGPGNIGNTVNSASWDGATLGTQWKLWCPAIDVGPVLVSDTRDGNGTGEVTYRTTYAGGFFWMSKTGPWGDNTVDYPGTVSSFIATATYQYVLGQLLGIRSNITTFGQFDGYGDCMEYTINNAAFLGEGTVPDYCPPYMDSSCALTGLSLGGWGHAHDLAIRILGCEVPVNQSTWTGAKTLYR